MMKINSVFVKTYLIATKKRYSSQLYSDDGWYTREISMMKDPKR